VIPNGVAVPPSPAARPARDVPVVISVTRLQAPKDTTTLVRALGLVERPCRCLVVGDGPERASVEAAIAAQDGRAPVELLGDRSDVGELLADADVFVLSSRSEGMPLSILEAMAAGLPVVASSVGGIPELVRDGETGRLVPPGNEGSLATALEETLDDPELRARLGAAGRRRVVDHFSVEACRAAHLELFRSLLRR
jgi:glycosyltransferase involved in cell wall biosynthesis